jgi:hypothetical protein
MGIQKKKASRKTVLTPTRHTRRAGGDKLDFKGAQWQFISPAGLLKSTCWYADWMQAAATK